MSSKTVHVAAAVIRDGAGNILIARRPDDKHQGGFWEFPGGKVETGESVLSALGRELQEELGIEVLAAHPLIRVPYQYPDKSVLLDVYEVDRFRGEAWGREGQPVKWVTPAELEQHQFPAANQPILNACLLPRTIAITPYDLEPDQWLEYADTMIAAGAEALMLRCQALSAASGEFKGQWDALLELCRSKGCMLILNGTLELAKQWSVDALHLSSERLRHLNSRVEFTGRWLSASCHDPEEVLQAQEKGVEFITLSPVAKTSSHPDAEPLGWAMFSEWVKACRLPVYALGGVKPEDCARAREAGAQGIAGISAWR
ncbi:Nudix family hydrolase [Neptuniibacter halophilus]|uniref:Nudix family hydrolase n=1 Tax=Neptuniibacter halophilus TaxID=651666 RepID=UPI0025724105|nr:Nudix family hydrolase [Neptuniibacter halophilus]